MSELASFPRKTFGIGTALVVGGKLLSNKPTRAVDLEHQLMMMNAGQAVTHSLIAESAKMNFAGQMAIAEEIGYSNDLLNEIQQGQEEIAASLDQLNFRLEDINDSLVDLKHGMVAGFLSVSDEIVRLRAVNVEANTLMGEMLKVQQNQAKTAASEWREMALQQYETCAKVDGERALGLYREMHDLLTRAIEANPTDYVSYMNLGWIDKNVADDVESALAHYEKASLLSMREDKAYSAYCHRHLASSLYEEGSFEQVVTVCNDGINITDDDDDTPFFILKAKALCRSGSDEEGIRVLRDALKADPNVIYRLITDQDACSISTIRELIVDTVASKKTALSKTLTTAVEGYKTKASELIEEILNLQAEIEKAQHKLDELSVSQRAAIDEIPDMEVVWGSGSGARISDGYQIGDYLRQGETFGTCGNKALIASADGRLIVLSDNYSFPGVEKPVAVIWRVQKSASKSQDGYAGWS